MVSNDEIRLKLASKRRGVDPEDLQKPQTSYEGSYLVCDACGNYYELKRDESPEDFSLECDCGGNLVYQESLSSVEKETPPSKSSSTSRNLAILLVVGIAMFFIVYILPIVYMMSAPFFVFRDSSPGAFFVMLLCLALVFSGIYTAYYLIKVLLRANN